MKLMETKVGCNVNNVFINHMMYAYDTALIAPSLWRYKYSLIVVYLLLQVMIYYSTKANISICTYNLRNTKTYHNLKFTYRNN